MARTRGLITDSDKQKFLRSVYEENVARSMSREIETNFNTDFYEECPYEHKVHLFKALTEDSDSYVEKITTKETSKSGEVKEVTRTYLVSRCENTGKYVYFWFHVTQSGDLLTGVRNITDVHSMTEEELAKILVRRENAIPQEHSTMRPPPIRTGVKKPLPPKRTAFKLNIK